MNITYVLGNGFDLHNGLKTSYKDFYNYLETVVNENNGIFNEISSNPELWSDFEDQLGNYINKVSIDEISVERLENDFVELLEHLIAYMKLIDEEYKSKFINDPNLLVQFIQQIFSLQSNLEIFSSKMERNSDIVKKVSEYSKTIMPKSSDFNIISLNYTTYLDDYSISTQTIQTIQKNGGLTSVYHNYYKPLHIHGNVLSENMLLGLETGRELQKEFQSISNMIKKRLHATDIHKGIPDLTNSMNVIKGTDIFVFFGVSFGKTDEDLIKEIYEENPKAYFIIHVYIENNSLSEKRRKENKMIEAISSLIGIPQEKIKESDNFIFLSEAEALFGNVSLPRAQ